MPMMYDELASWWPLLSPPADYEEEAGSYARMLEDACAAPIRTVLELGSGGGNNAWHLKRRFEMVLVEPSAGMRTVSRALNPECEHVGGDMRTVRLAREFDAVFVHDAVCYMTTESDLQNGDRDRLCALQARRRGALRPGFRPGELPILYRSWGLGRGSSRSQVPGMDVGS